MVAEPYSLLVTMSSIIRVHLRGRKGSFPSDVSFHTRNIGFLFLYAYRKDRNVNSRPSLRQPESGGTVTVYLPSSPDSRMTRNFMGSSFHMNTVRYGYPPVLGSVIGHLL